MNGACVCVRVVSGTSFDFHKQSDHLFLVGTEDGKIHKVGARWGGTDYASLNNSLMGCEELQKKDAHKSVRRKSFGYPRELHDKTPKLLS